MGQYMRTTVVTLGLLISGLAVPAAAQAAEAPAVHAAVSPAVHAAVGTQSRNPECRFGTGTRAMVRTIWCITNHENGLRDDRRHALMVADRESNFQASAENDYSRACGIYQHLPNYWPGRFRDYTPDRYAPYGTGCFNGRTNIIVALIMVKRGGWSPWGG